MAVLISVTEGDVTQIVLADVGVQGATGPSSPASGTPFTPYGNIAATNVQTAIQELDDEKFGKAGGTVTGNLEIGTGGTLSFEGATADGFETTLAVVDPTADRTLTLPNVTGTFVTTGDTGTVTSTMLLDGTILNADVNASAAIAGTKISPDFGSQTIVTTGVHSAAAGSAAAPSIAFTGDLDTGIYSPGANQVAISTNGTGRLFVDASGNIGVNTGSPLNYSNRKTLTLQDTWGGQLTIAAAGVAHAHFGTDNFSSGQSCRIESQDGIVFYPSGVEKLRITSAGLVGIGTSAPATALEVLGFIQTQSGAFGGGGYNIRYTSNASSRSWQLLTDNTVYGDFTIQQSTTQTGSTYTPRLYISAAGNVGIGTTAPGSILDCVSPGNPTIILRGSDGAYSSIFDIRAATGGSSIINANGGQNTLQLWTNSQQRAAIDSSGRLLVGTSTARSNFFNTSTVAPALQVEGITDSTAALSLVHSSSSTIGGPLLILGKQKSGGAGGNTIVPDGNQLGVISFQGCDGSELVAGASIEAWTDSTTGANDMPSRLVFSTTADGAASPTERMRITNGGNVGIGTSGPIYSLESASSDDVQISLTRNSVGRWLLGTTSANNLKFNKEGGAEAMRFDASSRVLVGLTAANTSGAKLQTSDGITFPATQVASADPNTLDDYEEGTWTPSYKADTTDPTVTYDNINSGKYTKVGRIVHIQVTIQSSIVSSAGSGALFIGGLPFTPQTDAFGGYSTFASGFNTVAPLAANERIVVMLEGGDGKIRLYPQNDDTAVFGSALTGSALNSNASARYLFFSGSYLVG